MCAMCNISALIVNSIFFFSSQCISIIIIMHYKLNPSQVVLTELKIGSTYLLMTCPSPFLFLPSLFHRLHSRPSTSLCVWVTQTFGCPSRRARSVNRKSHRPLPRRLLPSSRSAFNQKPSARWNNLPLFTGFIKSLHTLKTVWSCLRVHPFTCGLSLN